MIKYSEEELIEYLIEYNEKEGHIPTKKSINDNENYPCATTFSRYFGSWNNALKEAGLDRRKENESNYTNDELITLMTNIVIDLGRKPTYKEINDNKELPHATTFIRHFGSLRQTMYIVNDNIKIKEIEEYNKQKLIDFLKNYNEVENKVPTINIITSNPDYPKLHVFKHYFGTWSNALKAADLKIKKSNKIYTDLELIEMLQTYENAPTIRELRQNEDFPHSDTFVYRFGSWNNALVAAGFEIKNKNKNKNYDSDEMIENLKKFVDDLGYYPSRKEVNDNPNLASSISYSNRFGSWRNVLEKIGYYD